MAATPSSSTDGTPLQELHGSPSQSKDRERSKSEEDTSPAERDIHLKDTDAASPRCGVWQIGAAFTKNEKIRAGLARLGPFILDSCACPLPQIKTDGSGWLDSDDDDDGTSTDLRELQELQLNDVIQSSPSDDHSSSPSLSDRASIEEVLDRVFAERPVEEAEAKRRKSRKRKEQHTDRRNFVKHNLRRRSKALPRKRSKPNKKTKQTPPLPIRPEAYVE